VPVRPGLGPTHRRGRLSGAPLKPRLVADIGGTNVRFALVADAAPGDAGVLSTADFPDVTAAAEDYLSRTGGVRPTVACFAVACPVRGDRIVLTNSPWSFSIEAVRRRLGLERLLVVNDFKALGAAVPLLRADERARIGGRDPVAGRPAALLGPGTGLGVAALVPCGDDIEVVEGEGGHIGFAPADEREIELLRLLARRYGRVSAERVLSGPGLVAVHEALATLRGVTAERLDAAQIVERGRAGTDALCRETLDLFCAALGTVAGDLALLFGAHGGVFIGGGIAPRIVELLAHSDFRRRFEDKGRIAGFIADVPAFVITAEMPALSGAAALLARALGPG